jgi:hypothetical protein
MYVIFDLFSWNVGGDSSIRAQQDHNWDYNDSMWNNTRWNQLWTNFGNFVRNDGNVYLQLGNEPDDYSNQGWSSAMYERQRLRYENTISMLRSLGFDNPIIIPGTGFGTTLSNWPSRANSLNDQNIMFDIHRYWYHQVGDSDELTVTQVRNALAARGVDDLINMGYRVLLGEFGVHGSEGNQDSRDRQWFQSMIQVCEDGFYGQHIDTCYQSFQPGTDFPGIQAGSYSTGWYNNPPTTSMTWFSNSIPSDLPSYGDLPPDPGTYEQIYSPTSPTLPFQVTGNVGYSVPMYTTISTLQNAIGAYLRLTLLDTADGGAYGSGNEEGYVDIGSSSLPLPVSPQGESIQGDVTIPLSDLVVGQNTFTFRYMLSFTGFGYRVDAAPLHVVYSSGEGQPFIIRLHSIPGMGLHRRI